MPIEGSGERPGRGGGGEDVSEVNLLKVTN